MEYDPDELSFSDLLDTFWSAYVGPSGNNQYRSAIWYQSEEERALAARSLEAARASGKYMPFQVAPGAVSVEPRGEWYEAEAAHQNKLFGSQKAW